MNPVPRLRRDVGGLMSVVSRYLVAGVLMLAAALPLLFQTPQSVAPTVPVPFTHPDLSGNWVRIRANSNFILDCPCGKTVPLFGERVHISLDSMHFRVGHTPQMKELPLDGSEIRNGKFVERAFWEVDATTHADTLVWLKDYTDSKISRGGGPMVPAISEGSIRLWPDPDGSLIVRMNSLTWAKGSAKPVYPQGSDLETNMTYVRKHQFQGLKKAAAAFEIVANSDLCAISVPTVSAMVTRVLSDGKMAIVNPPAGPDTAMVHVTVHSTRNDVPKTGEPFGFSILCNTAVSVEITDRKSPPSLIYRHGRSLSLSAGNITNPVLHEIEAALGEFTTAVRAVRLAN
jgi:hypothetical protein